MRLLLGGDIHLNPGPFSPIRELDMLIDIVTKNCKNLNICLFNARSLNNKFDFFTEILTNLTQNAILILTETSILTVAISGLTLSNTEKPTRVTSQGVTLIDHGFSSKHQIQEVQIFPYQLKWIT